MVFSDWRRHPTLADDLQAGGLSGAAASRAPHTGYFRHQCEHVVWVG